MLGLRPERLRPDMPAFNARYAGCPPEPTPFSCWASGDIYEQKGHLNETETELFSHGEKLFYAIQKGQEVAYGSYPCRPEKK